MNYERDVQIDESSLDVEWLEQASLAIRYGKNWADCKDELARAEENVKVVIAELTLEINQNPEKYLGDGVKSTDIKVESAVKVHKKYTEAKERYFNAMVELNTAEIAKNEISFTRKAALENLVQLYIAGYFAGPKIPRDLKTEKQNYIEKRKENNARIRKITR